MADGAKSGWMRAYSCPHTLRAQRRGECPRGLRCSGGRADARAELLGTGTPSCASSARSAAACAAAKSTRARGGAWQPQPPRRALPATPRIELPCSYPPSAGPSRGRARARSTSTSWAAAAAVGAVRGCHGRQCDVHVRACRCMQAGRAGGVVWDVCRVGWPLGRPPGGCAVARCRSPRTRRSCFTL